MWWGAAVPKGEFAKSAPRLLFSMGVDLGEHFKIRVKREPVVEAVCREREPTVKRSNVMRGASARTQSKWFYCVEGACTLVTRKSLSARIARFVDELVAGFEAEGTPPQS